MATKAKKSAGYVQRLSRKDRDAIDADQLALERAMRAATKRTSKKNGRVR